jgi:two-component system, NarL family, sensor histidine kinase DegS
MADEEAGLAAQLADRRSAAQRELDEIELLMRQVSTEADRHADRREAAAARLRTLMDEHAVADEVREAHEQLVLQSQRSALMSAQIEVLEGKQKVLQRLVAGLDEASSAIAGLDTTSHGNGTGSAKAAGPAAAGQSRAVMAAQEEMRREIARQMHDGPAQSIANIALQAEVVQRLMARDPQAAQHELGELRAMVQHALEATKTFIFDVRPMVLDDLGLVPTLRRAAGERQRRSGLPVRFETTGADRRLERDVETQLFRIIDDVLTALVARTPSQVALRLDWTDQQLKITVRSQPPAPGDRPAAGEQPAAARGEVPSALADMIRDQHADAAAREVARRRAYGLPDELWGVLEQRAATVGISLQRTDDGLRVESRVDLPNGTTR